MVTIARKKKPLARTKDELAHLLDVSTEMLRRYQRKGLDLGESPYDPEAARAWIALNIDRRKRSDDDPEGAVKIRRRRDLWQLRNLRESAIAKQTANAISRRELIDVAAARQWVIEKFLRIKQRLELLPNELQILAPEEIRPLLRSDMQKAIRSLLLEMSNWKLEPMNEAHK